jgi:hypothetical protein
MLFDQTDLSREAVVHLGFSCIEFMISLCVAASSTRWRLEKLIDPVGHSRVKRKRALSFTLTFTVSAKDYNYGFGISNTT